MMSTMQPEDFIERVRTLLPCNVLLQFPIVLSFGEESFVYGCRCAAFMVIKLDGKWFQMAFPLIFDDISKATLYGSLEELCEAVLVSIEIESTGQKGN